MGADIHLMLGRIKPRQLAITDQSDSAPTATDQALSLLVGRELRRDDIELIEVPDEYELYRNYRLFSWLANVRGDLKPLQSNLIENKSRTWEILKLLAKRPEVESEVRTGFGCWESNDYDDPEHLNGYWLGDHSHNLITLAEINAFDFDQNVSRMDADTNTYVRDLNEKCTYRDEFGEQLFKLIDYCNANGWEFLLFGFDS